MIAIALRRLLPLPQVIHGGLLALLLYLGLYFSTERWRVYSNDILPSLSASAFLDLHFWLMMAAWTIPTFVYSQLVALLAKRWKLAWWLLMAYVPAVVVSYRAIIDIRLRNSITSCANHSGVWWNSYDYDPAKPLPDSLEFQDLLRALWGDSLRLHAARCPGYRLSGTETGVIFVAGGLHLNSLRSESVLVGFCSWLSHPPPHDHQHCVIWEWAAVNDGFQGRFRRECTDTAGMIQKLEHALKKADVGQIPYSMQARSIIKSELERRKQLARALSQIPGILSP